MFGRKRKAAIKAETSGLQSGLKWGYAEFVEVAADSPAEAMAIADAYVQRLHASDPRCAARHVPLPAEWKGVRVPKRITETTKVIHVVLLRFEDDPQDKFLTA